MSGILKKIDRPTHTVGQPTIEALKTIAEADGGILLPEKVIEAARPLNSPLHNRFEWDDNEAAEKYRLIQARLLINICVEVIPNTDTYSKVFVSLSTDRYDSEHGGYRIMQEVVNNQGLHQQMLEDALASMESFRHKYEKLKELRSVFLALDESKRIIKSKKIK